MTTSDPSPPSRVEIAAQWTALIEGRTTREAIHAWTVPWVEGDTPIDDPMALSALTHLNGFDLTRHSDRPTWMAHGSDRHYLHSAAHIAEELTRWRIRCDQYDADPRGWTERSVPAGAGCRRVLDTADVDPQDAHFAAAVVTLPLQ